MLVSACSVVPISVGFTVVCGVRGLCATSAHQHISPAGRLHAVASSSCTCMNSDTARGAVSLNTWENRLAIFLRRNHTMRDIIYLCLKEPILKIQNPSHLF